jgi:uncharacterized protein YdiU (UPF0061 family)
MPESAHPLCALLEWSARAHRALMARLAGGRLLPRRDEHRQHVDLGLTIDYGPFGFLDAFEPRLHLQPLRPPGPLRLRAPSPTSPFWNLHALAQALLPLMRRTEQRAGGGWAVRASSRGARARMRVRAKLGPRRADGDGAVDAAALMAADRPTSRSLRRLAASTPTAPQQRVRDCSRREAFDAWARATRAAGAEAASTPARGFDERVNPSRAAQPPGEPRSARAARATSARCSGC